MFEEVRFPDEFYTGSNPDDPRIKLPACPERNLRDGILFLGFPHDEGVARNGGRIGAAGGPAVVRGFLSQKMGAVVNFEYGIDLRHSKVNLGDDGDVSSGSLEHAHSELRAIVSQIIKHGSIPFVVGGGNDQSYPNAAGLMDAIPPDGRVGVMNIDAHFDVRPLKNGQVHSGSPFRLLLESDEFSSHKGTFIEFASQGSQCSVEHYRYIMQNRKHVATKVISLLELRRGNVVDIFRNQLESMGDHIFISFDIDSISGADAPGVSCPATIGLSAQEALDICFCAGQCKKVKLFDVSEFNPKIEDYRTGRLVANMFYFFVMGFSQRGINCNALTSPSKW